MSTDFRFTNPVSEDHFRRVLPKVGMTEHQPQTHAAKNKFCITDGENYVWVYVSKFDNTVSFSAFSMQAVTGGAMLDLIANELNTTALCEHDEGFFGD